MLSRWLASLPAVFVIATGHAAVSRPRPLATHRPLQRERIERMILDLFILARARERHAEKTHLYAHTNTQFRRVWYTHWLVSWRTERDKSVRMLNLQTHAISKFTPKSRCVCSTIVEEFLLTWRKSMNFDIMYCYDCL